MNVETLFSDKKFINDQLKSVPRYFWGQLSNDEIKSDLSLAICNCAKSFNGKKFDNIGAFVRKAFINNLSKTLRDVQFIKESEAPLEAAYHLTYEDTPSEKLELLSYLGTLPDTLLSELTEFVLGKKNKEEIVSNPSFKKLNVEKVIANLDRLI